LIAKTPTDTITVETGTLTVEESATGYIIRDETVVQGDNYKNGIYQIVTEGVRTAKGQTIFRYYGKSEDELQSKIDEIDQKIQVALEKEENTVFSTDIKSLESQIDDKIQNLKTTTDVQTLAEYKKTISEIMIKKAKIAGESSQSGSYIKKLIAQREEYETKLMQGSEYIKAPVSGVVSYRVDGLEEVLTVDGLEDLTSQELDELDVKTGKIVSTSDESAKIIDNFGCYLAAVLDSDTAKQAEVGDTVKITLSSGTEVSAKIYSISQQEDDKMLIIFKLTTLNDELISYRKISFNITWWSYSGIKVPNSAILDGEDNLKYVVKKTTTGTTNILVKVLKKNDQFSIISTYSSDDLKNLGIDSSTYRGIDVYDTIMMYPQKD
jgi:putative membrane fusion protein